MAGPRVSVVMTCSLLVVVHLSGNGSWDALSTRSSSPVVAQDEAVSSQPVPTLAPTPTKEEPAPQWPPPRHMENDHRIIFFLHIHKAGGTAMCNTAMANGMQTFRSSTIRNCNVQADGRCCGNSDTLEAQQEFARTTNLTFVACEGPMYEAMDPEHYRYITALRKGESRYQSQWKMLSRQHKHFATPFDEWWKAQPDNWATRQLCGSKCEGVGQYKMTPDMFDHTLQRLRLFENIVLLDDYNRTFAKVERDLRWTQTVSDRKKNMEQWKKKKRPYPPLGETVWDSNMSILDDVLYEYARQLNERGAAVFVRVVESDGPVLSEGMNALFCEALCCSRY